MKKEITTDMASVNGQQRNTGHPYIDIYSTDG